MMFKKQTHSVEQNHHSKRGTQESPLKSMTPEERHQIAMEMSMGNIMLPPGCFPDGIWHFY